MYRIFIFCISFFSVSFLLAEKLPDTFESETIDISKTYSFFSDLIKPKDEFETTKEYTERVKKQVMESSLLKGDPDRYFYVPLEEIEFRYDADKQEGTFGNIRIRKVSDYKVHSNDLYRLALKKTTSHHKTFMGENAYGVQKEISSWIESVDVIVFHNDRDDIAQPFWSKEMDVATAKAAKQNCKAVVRFCIAPEEKEPRVILFTETEFQKPTIDAPYEVSTIYSGLYVKSVSLIFYDKETKEIFWNIDLANYKNKYTLEREASRQAEIERRQAEIDKLRAEREEKEAKRQAEKQAEEKKKNEHAKKVLEFYQDWETPEGKIFAKYIKSQKNIVIFEKEDGSQVQVNYEDLTPQYQDLIKLSKTFKKVKNTLVNPRMWDEPGSSSSRSGSRNSTPRKKFKAAFVKLSTDPESYRKDLYVFLRLENKNIRMIPLSQLSERDKKWFENTYNEFLKAKQHYEEKYFVRLLDE